VAQPFTPAGIYAMEQWKRIGVDTEHVQIETKLWFDGMAAGTFDVAVQNISDFADVPTAQFNTLLSRKVSTIAYSRHMDTKIDEMYDLQSKTIDPVERMKIVNALETYTLGQAYNVPLLWYQRIVVNHKKVKGWELPPSHFGGQTLVDVWLDE
jgi:peptide/nickel transport system substrate-binding protein